MVEGKEGEENVKLDSFWIYKFKIFFPDNSWAWTWSMDDTSFEWLFVLKV